MRWALKTGHVEKESATSRADNENTGMESGSLREHEGSRVWLQGGKVIRDAVEKQFPIRSGGPLVNEGSCWKCSSEAQR